MLTIKIPTKIHEGDGIRVEDENGKNKFVETADLVNAINQVQGETRLNIRTPRYCRLLSITRNNVWLMMDVPPARRTIHVRFSGEKEVTQFNDIGVPRTLLFFLLEKRGNIFRLINTRMRAIKQEVLSWDEQTYNFPYGNVYNSGEVCWGEVTLPEIRSISQADQLVQLFFDTVFNGDLYEESRTGMSLISLIKYHKGKDYENEKLGSSTGSVREAVSATAGWNQDDRLDVSF